MKHINLIHKDQQSYLEDLLITLRRSIFDSIKKEAVASDLTFSQMEVIRYLCHNPTDSPKTMKSIAEYLKITPPSATVLVAQLEQRGLIKRRQDEKDRRVVFIIPTKKTENLFDSICKSKKSVFNNMIRKLNPNDQKSLERIIKILITNK